MAVGRARAARAAEHELETMKRQGEIPPPLYEEMRSDLEEARKKAVDHLHELVLGLGRAFGARRRHARERVLKAQRVALQHAARRGVISDDVLDLLTHEIDASLSEDPPPPPKKDEPPEAPPSDPPAPDPAG